MPKALNLVGQTFNRLTVVSKATYNSPHSHWNCVCSCGTEITARGIHLTSGNTKSCGCLKQELFQKVGEATRFKETHGATKVGNIKQSYRSWQAMMARCYKTERDTYDNWGGRGIAVCPEWHDYLTFAKDMGEPSSKGLSIERRDNEQNYCPSNCYWATSKQQGRNKRNNHILEYNGVSKCISEWAEDLSIPYKTLHNRICSMKWSVEKALTTPVRAW